MYLWPVDYQSHNLPALVDRQCHGNRAHDVLPRLERSNRERPVRPQRGIDVNEIDGRIGQNVLKTRVALLDAEGVERFLRASADGVHAGVRTPLIDRYELRAEAETNDCNVEDLRHWTVSDQIVLV